MPSQLIFSSSAPKPGNTGSNYALKCEELAHRPGIGFTVSGDDSGTIYIKIYSVRIDSKPNAEAVAISLERYTKFLRSRKIVTALEPSLIGDGQALLDNASSLDRVFATVVGHKIAVGERALKLGPLARLQRKELLLQLDALRLISDAFAYEPLAP